VAKSKINSVRRPTLVCFVCKKCEHRGIGVTEKPYIQCWQCNTWNSCRYSRITYKEYDWYWNREHGEEWKK
jgi:hypothetical protein